MIKFRTPFLLFAALLGATAAGMATPALAQANRTWVSGTGNDANPCTRALPCLTFAGALAVTNAGGEINCVDAGGFGPVNTNKSITIDCTDAPARILVTTGTGINISDAATGSPGSIVVVLRGLTITGVVNGAIGINFASGLSLTIEHAAIQNFNSGFGSGFAFRPATAARLEMRDVLLSGSPTGITIAPTGSGSARVNMYEVHSVNNNQGFRVDTGTNVDVVNGILISIERSEFSNNGVGFNVSVLPATSAVSVMLKDSSVANNSTRGIDANGSANATIRVANTTIVNNGIGILAQQGANVASYGNNQLNNNAVNGAFTGSILPPQ